MKNMKLLIHEYSSLLINFTFVRVILESHVIMIEITIGEKNKTHRYPLAKTKERQLSPGVLHRSPVAVAAAAAITLRCRLFPGCSADPESGRRCPHVEESLRWQLRSASCARRHVLFISQFRLLIWQKFIIFRLLKINRLNMDQLNKKIIKIFNNYIIDF